MVKKRKFGSVFKILRKLKGFSQFKLNELAGVKVTSISRYGWSVKKMSCGYFIERARIHAGKVLGYFLSKTLEVFMDAFCGLEDA